MTDFAIPGLMPVTTPIYDETPPVFRLERHRALDSKWAGVERLGPVTFFNPGEAPVVPSVSAASAILEFRPRLHEGCTAKTLKSEDDKIVINDAELWDFTVPPQELDLMPGIWDWKFIVTDTDGETYLAYTGTLLVTP